MSTSRKNPVSPYVCRSKEQSIKQYEEIIVQSVKNNPVTIIEGATACGKSSMIPTFIAKAGYRVIVTEQKRLNCISLATRVANIFEKQPVGSLVGYHTASKSNLSDSCKIIFVTEAAEFLRLIHGIENTENTVFVIDEVHENTLYADLLISILKKTIDDGCNIKVILMSATMNSKELSDFFNNAPIISIASKSYTIHNFDIQSQEIPEVVSLLAVRQQGVLVFLPGKQEILSLNKDVQKCIVERKKSHNIFNKIFLLHSEMDYDEQKQIFDTSLESKVILSTNIAQTSLNIKDLAAVIDSGLERRLEYIDNVPTLCLHNISKASCTQRMGRVGRFSPGSYYLCSNMPYESREDYITPEIYYADLTDTLLMLMSANIDINSLPLLHKPIKRQVKVARKNLMMLGAVNSENGTITEIGRSMSKIPLDARSARMLVEGKKYGVEFDILICSLLMSIGSICKDINDIPDSLKNKDSDLFTEMNVFKALYYTSKTSAKQLRSLLGKYHISLSTYNKILESLNIVVSRFKIDTSRHPINEVALKKCLLVNRDYVFVRNNNIYKNNTYTHDRFTYKYSIVGTSSMFLLGVPRDFSNIPDSLAEVRHRLVLPTKFTLEELLEYVPELFTRDNYFLNGGKIYTNLYCCELRVSVYEVGALYDLMEKEPENFREEQEDYSPFDVPTVSLYYRNCKISTTTKTE